MGHRLTCRNCGHKVSVPAEYAGREVKCPKCRIDLKESERAGTTAPSRISRRVLVLACVGAGAVVLLGGWLLLDRWWIPGKSGTAAEKPSGKPRGRAGEEPGRKLGEERGEKPEEKRPVSASVLRRGRARVTSINQATGQLRSTPALSLVVRLTARETTDLEIHPDDVTLESQDHRSGQWWIAALGKRTMRLKGAGVYGNASADLSDGTNLQIHRPISAVFAIKLDSGQHIDLALLFTDFQTARRLTLHFPQVGPVAVPPR